ncbi:MAG: M1 family metallopeptidase [Acidimicrobiales bacterium]
MPEVETPRDPHRLPPSVIPRNYRLLIEPDFDAGTFCGSVTITADVGESGDAITLNSDGLAIKAVTVDDTAAPFALDPKLERLTIQAEPTGPTTSVSIDFSGTFNEQLVGFYLSHFTDLDGNERVMGTTQFEAPHARKAFPCWDEPSYKASYDISLRVPEGMESVSNAAEIGRDQHPEGGHTAHYATTMVMSTYLVAWVIGPLEFSETRDVDGVPLRVVSKPGMATMTEYALDAGEFALSYFAEYFGVPYPGDKVDLIGIPDFAFGAMENLGCITFREAILMIDPAVTTQAEKQRSVDVINHELAHMWFGDLVTMDWWEGIWLNEAFATFMEMKCTDEYRPSWNRWADFGLSRSSAFTTDALASTRPVEFDVHTPEESEGMFDILTYEKGAAVVRMLEQHLGEESFRRGLRLYMKKHAYGNTVTTDLWDALEEATGKPVREMMDGWIYQGGFPLIEVTFSDGVATLTQTRCLSTGGGTEAEPHRWQVPLRYSLITGDHRSLNKLVLDDEPVEIEVPDGAHLVVNSEGASFVRVSYPPELLESLSSLESNELNEVERYALIDDAWASVLASTTSTTTFLTLLEAMASETSRTVWQRIIAGLDRLDRLVDSDAHDGFKTIAHDILSPMLANIGLTPVENEEPRDRQLRADLVKAMGTIAEDPDVQSECQRTVSVGRRNAELVDPALMSAAITVAASVGDQADFDDYVNEYRTNTNPQEQLRYLYGLTAFPTDELVDQFRTMILNGEVRSQDAPYALRTALASRTSGQQTWEFIKEHWDRLYELLPSAALSRMLEGVTSLDTVDLVADVASFMAEHPLTQAEKTVEQILERHRVNAALRERESRRLSAFVTG